MKFQIFGEFNKKTIKIFFTLQKKIFFAFGNFRTWCKMGYLGNQMSDDKNYMIAMLTCQNKCLGSLIKKHENVFHFTKKSFGSVRTWCKMGFSPTTCLMEKI